MSAVKKFAVVGFNEEDTLEVIPCKWLNSEIMAAWPGHCSRSSIERMVKNCSEPKEDWPIFKVKIYFKTTAVLMRFQNLTACDIHEKLGRVLAADWNGRLKPSSET